MKRKRWKAPNNPMLPAKQVWRHLFPTEPWPNLWCVEWAGFMRNCAGLTIYSRRLILLNHADAKRGRDGWQAVRTLVHEFVHMRCGYPLRHGAEFTRIETELLRRVGL